MTITQCMQGDTLPACLTDNRAPECNITRGPICDSALQLVTMNNALVVVAMHVQPLFHLSVIFAFVSSSFAFVASDVAQQSALYCD